MSEGVVSLERLTALEKEYKERYDDKLRDIVEKMITHMDYIKTAKQREFELEQAVIKLTKEKQSTEQAVHRVSDRLASRYNLKHEEMQKKLSDATRKTVERLLSLFKKYNVDALEGQLFIEDFQILFGSILI